MKSGDVKVRESIAIMASPVNQLSLTSSALSQSQRAVAKQGRRDSILANMATLGAQYGDWKYDRF